ncbi:hypothetical protein SDRG_00653 [Saprolegnia diclina VS20]|uniref:Anoctamin transmembrane domain-containing protein n=1 Tax=Saprolegnia diclina (strain VS20) TaxID=1156394 RepID=T0R5U1_SAPDV|nr:hypothetical protein SDRG_00653 [Saprolegnia diclina VS20]EQC41790.1 hypothetical protein SDRG_00653 [Saprolegnia diclina VS20]|eukprot:XP_008604359.1 hypothetical protein SDRG_00653 [Saprolegnia diclina VS20]
MNPVDNSPQIWDMATATARRRRMVSYLVVFIMVLAVLVALGGLFYLKHRATKLSDPTDALWASGGVSVLNSIQINVLNMVYRRVAEKLNNWENHRTSVEYENHLITKVFLFQFCNSFAAFFYIAYIKAYVGDVCLHDSCLMELRVQLFVLFLLSTIVSNALEIAMPYISANFYRFLARTPETKNLKRSDLSDEETQALWAPYEEDDAFADYNEMAERTKYRLQTSNKPFSSVHAAKLARIAAASPDEDNVLHEAKAHLLTTRGHTKGISSKNEEQPTAPLTRAESLGDDEPEMDPWLISRGAEYQVKLHKALVMWGHNEAADGLFPPPATPPESLHTSAWQRFRNELIYVPRDPYNYFGLYTAFKSDAKLQPYYRHHPASATGTSEDTLFRSVDRIRLVHSILAEHINFDALKGATYFTDLFALHDEAALQHLTKSWATNWRLTRQPLGELRNYFGEKIALYFAWLEFYTKSLLLPAVIGIIIYVLDIRNIGNVAAGKIFFAGFIVVWSTFFTEFWKRKSEIYTVLWGVDESLDIDSTPRTQYKGVRRMNPIDNSPQIWDMATATARRRRMVSYLVVLIMVLAVLVALGGLFYLKHLATKLSDPTDAQWASVGVSVLNSIQINILNMVYRRVAEKLNHWENHRTSVQFENHLITKVFLFQFCNSFASFFYIAYIKAYIGDVCLNNSCLIELRVQLFVLFLLSTIVSNALEIAMPFVWAYVYRFLARTPATKNLKRSDLSDEEIQALWAPYEEDDAFADYNEMVIQYGFVTLFVVAMPITPAMALFNNVLEAHVDAYKLCKGHRRPYPHRVASIGSWYYFLCLMNYMAVVTNIGIILFTKDPDDKFTSNTSTTAKWIIFLIAEHVCILMKSAVAAAVPDVPRELAYLRDRHKDIEATVFLGQVPETNDDDDLSQQAEKLNLCIHATAAAAKAMPETKPAL